MVKLHRVLVIPLLLLAILVAGPTTSLMAQGGVTVTAKSQVNLRSGPGTTYSSLGFIPAKSTLPAVGRDAAKTWVQVNFNNTIGWLSVGLLTVTGDLNTLPVIVLPAPPKPISAASIRAATMTICKTHAAVNGAPAYDGQPGLHPAIFLKDAPKSGLHSWNSRMSGLTGAKPQLAVCIGEPITTTYQSCPYGPTGDHTLNLKDISVTVHVIMIATGQEIGSTILVGARPLDCQPTEYFYIGNLVRTRTGTAPTVDQLKAFITPFVKK